MNRTVTEVPQVPYGYAAPMLVHFDDLDSMGLLHNARYSLLFERIIYAWWSERSGPLVGRQPSDLFIAVREFQITYHQPVVGAGEVVVHFWVERVGETSIAYGFRVLSLDGETVHAVGSQLAVHLDPETLRPSPWSDHGRELAAQLVKS